MDVRSLVYKLLVVVVAVVVAGVAGAALVAAVVDGGEHRQPMTLCFAAPF